MQRRSFIRAAATASAIAWVSPMHKVFSAVGSAQTYPNQVPFVSGPEVYGLTADDIQTLFAINPAYTAQDQAATYPQSVASGDPQPTGIVLWTRIAPTAMGDPSAGNIAWQIAADSGFASILVQGVATVDPAADDTVKLPISNPVLAPYTVYYYRFVYNQIPQTHRPFKTLPAATAELAQLKSATLFARITTTVTTQPSATWRSKTSSTSCIWATTYMKPSRRRMGRAPSLPFRPAA